jgi:hypothetical protein
MRHGASKIIEMRELFQEYEEIGRAKNEYSAS